MEYPKFKVTVSCMTYNQSKYIKDAMNGFTMQQTSFPYVCTIVDDASTDGEQEVIHQYVEENFDFSEGSVAYHKETDYAHITYAQHKTNKNCYFAVLYLKENHYSQRKDKIIYLKEWRDDVEYMAICEGDDYWTDVMKLQKQVELLDNNSKSLMVYSNAKILEEGTNSFTGIWGGNCCSFEQIIQKNTIPTLTVLLRTKAYIQYRIEMESILTEKKWLMGDKPLWLWIAQHGDILYLAQTTGVYRIISGSASHKKSLKSKLEFNYSSYDINLYFDNKYNKGKLRLLIEDRYNRDLMKLYGIQHISIRQALKYFFKLQRHNINDYKIIIKSLLGK